MPELPDLQVFSHNLNKQLKGKTLINVTVGNAKKLNVTVKELKDAIEGEQLTKIERVGKELHFEFKNGRILGLHLMLRGQLHLYKENSEHKYSIIELLFDKDSGLVLTDFQGLATSALDPETSEAPDALSDKIDFKFLKEQLQRTRSAVKTILLDQHIIRGIGNAYADEILWHARISPFSAANKIPDDKIHELDKAIKAVLEDAEKQILKTHPDIISGEVRDFLKVHNSKKKQTDTGAAIHQKPISSRKTYYTDEQELFV
jgi:formamidopyrimidine-DNA glycosylase